MQTLVKNKFQEIVYYRFQNFFMQIWHKRTIVMSDKEFQKEMLLFFKQIKKRKVEKILIDMRNFFYIVVPEMQEWVDINVNNYIKKEEIRTAYLISPDDFTKISVNQTLEEPAGVEMDKEFFENFEEAKKFLDINI